MLVSVPTAAMIGMAAAILSVILLKALLEISDIGPCKVIPVVIAVVVGVQAGKVVAVAVSAATAAAAVAVIIIWVGISVILIWVVAAWVVAIIKIVVHRFNTFHIKLKECLSLYSICFDILFAPVAQILRRKFSIASYPFA